MDADHTVDAILLRLQKVELEILDVIAELCKREGISWFLDSGSALGALRHRGFIPWDDDIDIGMLRPDYDRFLELAPSLLPDGFSLHTPRNTKNYAAQFAKVCKDNTRFITQEALDANCIMGIYIDVFPFDYLTSEEPLRTKQIRRARLNVRLSYLYHSRHIRVPHKGFLGALESAACFIGHYVLKVFCSPNRFIEGFEHAASLGLQCKQKSSECICHGYSKLVTYPIDVFIPISLGEFEGRKLPIPGNVGKYLSMTYGDWKELPSEADRKTHMPLKVIFDTDVEPEGAH